MLGVLIFIVAFNIFIKHHYKNFNVSEVEILPMTHFHFKSNLVFESLVSNAKY